MTTQIRNVHIGIASHTYLDAGTKVYRNGKFLKVLLLVS